jgi:hypothetical protein
MSCAVERCNLSAVRVALCAVSTRMPLAWPARPKAHHRIHKSPTLDTILGQFNLLHALPPNFFNITFNIYAPIYA